MSIPVQVRDFGQALRAADAARAVAAARAATTAGVPLLVVYEQLRRVLVEVGSAWEHGEIDVAAEHEITAAASAVVAQLRGTPLEGSRGAVLLTTAPGQLHTLGITVLQHLFEQVHFRAVALLDLPYRDMAAAARRIPGLVAVLISAHLPLDDDEVFDGLQQLRQTVPGVSIIIGGPAFQHRAGGLHRHGADATLITAEDALAAVAQLAGPLTVREAEVLRRIAEGLTNGQIAEELGVSSETIKEHVTSVMRKLGTTSRAAAVATAYRHGQLS